MKTWTWLSDSVTTKHFYSVVLLLLLLLLSHFSCVRLCVTPETAAHQAPPSLGFSRQEHWSGLPFPSPKWKVKVKSLSPMDCSPPGSSIHGIFQARVLEWGAIVFSIVSAIQHKSAIIIHTPLLSLASLPSPHPIPPGSHRAPEIASLCYIETSHLPSMDHQWSPPVRIFCPKNLVV